jgi:hypothetical protein
MTPQILPHFFLIEISDVAMHHVPSSVAAVVTSVSAGPFIESTDLQLRRESSFKTTTPQPSRLRFANLDPQILKHPDDIANRQYHYDRLACGDIDS